jgi:hypothetical protein
MAPKELFNFRLYFTGVLTMAIWSLLIWSLYHGGVPSHHILQREDLPAISNWWGGFLLPIITWILLYLIQVRIKKQNLHGEAFNNSKNQIILSFWGLFTFGVFLAVSFSYGLSIVLDNILYVLLFIAFMAPIFRPEYILGFIIGMTFTFGVILPTAFALIVVLISAPIYTYIRPLLLKLVQRTKKTTKLRE